MRNQQRAIVSSLSAALAAGSISLLPFTAHAQLVLEEVVVTARKREESLQETPIAVTALSGENLQEMGLADISDLRKVAPNVDLYDGNGTGGTGNVFIRGVGARNTGVNFDSGVGIYVDGVYVSRPDGAVLDNVDLQSVQVLRGPQGTLFGKNTTGGAILYTTNKPNEELGGHVDVRLGNYNQLDGKVTVNVPINDTLQSRFSIYATTRDGYVESVSNGNPGILDGEEFSDIDRRGGQAQLRWLASDDLILDLNYSHAETDQAARGQNCEVVRGVPGAGWQALLQDENIVVPSTGKTIAEWCQENDDLGIDKIQADLAINKYEAETNTLSLTAEWDLNDDVNFKSITAWRSTEGASSNELDAIGIPNLHRSNYGNGGEPTQTDAYSQELQFAGSAFDDKLEYVIGVFGFYEDTSAGTLTSPSGPFFGSLNNPNVAFYINQTAELLAENTSFSAFSQTDWNFNEAWSMTLGVRYTWEERKLTRTFRLPDITTLATTGDATLFLPASLSTQFFLFPGGIDTFNPDHAFVNEVIGSPGEVDPLNDQQLTIDNSDITPMASLQYTFEQAGFINGGTVYATVSNGFLSGGITDTVNILSGLIEEFDPEEVWNYELGAKVDAWDNRLRVNMALFHTEYENRQLTTVRINPVTGRIDGALINAKSSSITGLEIEATVIPVENLQIIANFSINDGKLDEYEDERISALPDPSALGAGCSAVTVGFSQVQNCPIDRSDENLPRLPEEIYYLAAMYNWETEMGRIMPMVAWSYRTNVDNCFDRASCLSGVYGVDQEDLTARLSWFSKDESLRITAYGNNLTDERYITGGTPLVDVTETAGTVYNLPRTYGVEIAYDF